MSGGVAPGSFEPLAAGAGEPLVPGSTELLGVGDSGFPAGLLPGLDDAPELGSELPLTAGGVVAGAPDVVELGVEDGLVTGAELVGLTFGPDGVGWTAGDPDDEGVPLGAAEEGGTDEEAGVGVDGGGVG